MQLRYSTTESSRRQITDLRSRLSKSFVAVLPDPAAFKGFIAACCIGLILGYAIQIVLHASPGFRFGGPADFTIYYTAAHIIRAGQGAQLYDLGLQAKVQQSFLLPYGGIMPSGLLPYNYPPFGALLYLPFSFLPLHWAFHAWNAANVVLVLVCVALLIPAGRGSPGPKTFLTVSLAVFSFYPVARVFGYGQSSLLVVVCVALSYVWLKNGKDLPSGMVLAVGLLKPQLVVTLLLVFIYRRRWRIVLGFAATSAMLVTVSALLVGSKGLYSYLVLLQSAMSPAGIGGLTPPLMPNIRGTAARLAEPLASYFGTSVTFAEAAALTVLLSLPVVAFALWLWRSQWNPSSSRFPLQYALTILCSLLLSPHVGDPDFSLLVIAGFLVSSHFSSVGDAKTGLLIICAAHLGYFTASMISDNSVRAQIIQILVLACAIPLIAQIRCASRISDGTETTSSRVRA